jgi:hypothetical protein
VLRKELREDPRDYWRRNLVEFEPVQTASVGRFSGIGMRSSVRYQVAKGGPPAKKPALDLGLCGHGSAHPDLHPLPLSLAHPAEHAHYQVMGLVGRVDRATDLGHPQRHPVVLENRESQAILVAVERPVWLADYYCLENSPGIAQVRQQPRRLRATLPRDRTGLIDVKELGHDHSAAWLNQRIRPGQLPGPRRRWILVILRGHAAIKREQCLARFCWVHAASGRCGCRSADRLKCASTSSLSSSAAATGGRVGA